MNIVSSCRSVVSLSTLCAAFALAGCSASWEPESQQQEAPNEHVGESQAALTTCYGNTCDGKDPEASGCGADGVTVPGSPQTIVDFSGRAVGTIAIRKSAACNALWAHVTSTSAEWLRVDFRRSSPWYVTGSQSPTTTTGYKSPLLGGDHGATYTAVGYVGSAPGYYPFQTTVRYVNP